MNSRKRAIKNLVRMLIFILFVIYIGTFTTGMGKRGGGEGCPSYLFRQLMGVPVGDIPEQTQSMHDRILEYAEYRIHLYVPWVNRDWVTSEDGSYYNPFGLGYYGHDDIISFKHKLEDTYESLMNWSDYDCSPSGFGLYRPGGRKYGCGDCSLLPGGGNPCSDPPDCDYPFGFPPDCFWYFTGSFCYTYVAFVLQYTDQKKFGNIDPTRYADQMLMDIIDQGLGEIVTREEVIPGDLIFMDINGDGRFDDHVAFISYIGITFQYDRCLGIIGFYSSPFKYRACSASMGAHNTALMMEWGPYSNPNPPYWWVYQNRCTYVHLYE